MFYVKFTFFLPFWIVLLNVNVIFFDFPLPISLTTNIEMKNVSSYLAPFRIASLVVVLNASSLPLSLTL